MSTATHPEPEEIVDDHREVAEDTFTNAIGIVVPFASNDPETPKDIDSDPERDESSGIQK
jgi:hypothetical protein